MAEKRDYYEVLGLQKGVTADPREQQNVAGDHPDTVQELDAILTAERQTR